MEPTLNLYPGNQGRRQEHLVDYKLIAAVFATAVLLGAANWALGRAAKSVGDGAPKNAAAQAAPRKSRENVKSLSGRQLTILKMQQPKIPAQHFADDVYGVSFEAPRGYLLKAGILPDMDLGLGYLGTLPMEFAEPGGVRIATVEVPPNAYPGSDFVNAFLTVSAFPNTTAGQCNRFEPPAAYAEPPLRTKISGIEFVGIPNSEAASMHQYSGKYFHGFAEGTCYEVGYGIVTAGAGAHDGLKKSNNDAVLQKLERMLITMTIDPLQSDEEENSPTDTTPAPSESDNTSDQ